MLLDPVSFPLSELDRLCPFYLIISDASVTPTITGVGSVLRKVAGPLSSGTELSKHFEMVRPNEPALDFSMLSQSNKMIVLKCREPDFQLRGMFVRLSDTEYLYFSSVEVKSADSLQLLGLAVSDFSKADPTPDILVLHRFRELQMKDQQRQIEELRKLVVARDTFDRHANTDMLTGIGNRRMFFKQGSEMLAEDFEDRVIAILLWDLDGFKKINDTYGHDVGDAVLQNVAKRCEQVIHSFGIVSRLGGDEFVAMLRMSSREAIESIVEKLVYTIGTPMVCIGRHLSVQPSMGVSLLQPGQSVDEAIHFADLAMYEGRKVSRGLVNWFTPTMQKQEAYRKSLTSVIKDAIENGEFVPFFQPIVDFHSRSIHGYEALARWQHPVHGLIYPDVFIEVAAEAGCLHELDYAILENALDAVANWESRGQKLSMHVNLCATSVRAQLDDKVMTLLSERAIEPNRLSLELTETTLLDFRCEEKAVLDRLSDHGVNIQLDDFGTGFSSLTHLHDYPVNGLKIDRGFLHEFPNDSRSTELIESVMAIAQRLSLDVVTEGIETQEQMEWIESTGCRYGQGYLFGKPVPGADCLHGKVYWPIVTKKVA